MDRTLPCVWMSAGLLTYRLCDRDYDCEHCPLDAALRSERPGPPFGEPGNWTDRFPDDRSYAVNHVWLRRIDDGPTAGLRLGLDAFAAALIGEVEGVHVPEKGESIERELAEIDCCAGVLKIGSPVAGKIRARNESLDDRPNRLTTEPYDGGWLVELDAGDSRGALLDDGRARDAAEADLRWFRRRVAYHLFSDATAIGPSLPDGGEILTDLRPILGRRRYLRLLQQLFR